MKKTRVLKTRDRVPVIAVSYKYVLLVKVFLIGVKMILRINVNFKKIKFVILCF
jgi:hypothetical protein